MPEMHATHPASLATVLLSWKEALSQQVALTFLSSRMLQSHKLLLALMLHRVPQRQVLSPHRLQHLAHRLSPQVHRLLQNAPALRDLIRPVQTIPRAMNQQNKKEDRRC